MGRASAELRLEHIHRNVDNKLNQGRQIQADGDNLSLLNYCLLIDAGRHHI